MSDLLANLNPQQAAAVSAPPGPILVVAGPGSGKTAVLTRRIAFMIRELGISPYHLMAVTFTNKAAGEMQSRTEGLLASRAKGLSIGTFHSICARILRRESEAVGLKSNYVIYDTADQLSLMKEAMQSLKIDVEKNGPRKQLGKISSAKNELITPAEFRTESYPDRITKDIYAQYQKMLRVANAVDFDDLLMLTALLFRDNPETLAKYREFYPHLMVDEFQDTNVAQYQLITLLTGTNFADPRSLFCVGDPDQSIYRFRGADYRNIGNFQRDYPDARIILLEQNYRSHQIILDAAMAVIDKNPDRIRKELTTSRREGSKIMLRSHESETEEAMWVANTILDMKYRGQRDLNDFAVMYRINAQSRSLEEAFIRAGIPYKLIGGTRFYDRKEVRDILAYLRTINNPDDTVSLERILNVPKRGIGEQSIAKLRTWAASRNQTIFDALQSIANTSDHPFAGRTAKPLIEFAKLMAGWRDLAQTEPTAAIMMEVLEKTKYFEYLANEADTPEQWNDRKQNVDELRGMAFTAGQMKLPEFLEEIALVSDIDKYDQTNKAVVLMTLHAAKGLEFPVVFMPGLEEDILPHSMARGDDDQLQEERRLMYVGITRAKDQLLISWTLARSMYGQGERMLPSRFLEDIPEELTSGSRAPRRPKNTFSAQDRLDDDWRTTWSPPKPPQPTAPVPTPFANKPMPARLTRSMYKAGQKVLHQKFGQGVIIASRIRGDDEEIDVRFIGHGIKRLFASTANLVMVEE